MYLKEQVRANECQYQSDIGYLSDDYNTKHS